jgi:hypothetical protein
MEGAIVGTRSVNMRVSVPDGVGVATLVFDRDRRPIEKRLAVTA